jgi:membrane protein YdbS with pleckstrin-like domain
MGLYDVHIASATSASSIEAHIDGVDYAASEGLKKFFLDKVSGRGHAEKNDGSQPATSHSSGASEKVSKTIKLNEDISSDKYPLSNKWIGVSLVNKFISSFIISFFVLFVILGKAKNISFENAFVYIVLGWLILGVVIMIFRTIALFLWKKNYSFKFTPEHIYYREGVISLSEKHMPYSSIQDVTVKQGIIERMFGLARVFIENAAQQQVAIGRNGRPEAVFSGVILQGLSISDAKKITDILKTTVLGKDSSHYGL